jgi:hypothetical protein
MQEIMLRKTVRKITIFSRVDTHFIDKLLLIFSAHAGVFAITPSAQSFDTQRAVSIRRRSSHCFKLKHCHRRIQLPNFATQTTASCVHYPHNSTRSLIPDKKDQLRKRKKPASLQEAG